MSENWLSFLDEENESEFSEMSELNLRMAAQTSINRIHGKVFGDECPEDPDELEQCLVTLNSHFERFVDAHLTLVGAAKAGEIDAHEQLWCTVEDKHSAATVGIRKRIAAHHAARAQSEAARSMGLDLKLERLSIPEFDGSLHNWLAFRDTFDTLVHSQDYPEAYKLGKLRQAVKVEVVPLVGGWYSGGYAEVWEALKERYDSPKHLAETHVSRFINLKAQTDESSRNLLRIVDTVRESFRALKVMKLPVDQWDALAVPIVTSKLPTTTQQDWGMSLTSKEIPKLEDLLTFVEKRANSLTSELLKWPASAPTTPRPQKRAAPTSPRVAKSNLATTPDNKCAYCESTHHVGRCPLLMALSPAARFDKLKGSNLCFNCLRPGHSSRACNGQGCRSCGQRHNTLFCRQPQSSPSTSGVTATITTASEAKPQAAVQENSTTQ